MIGSRKLGACGFNTFRASHFYHSNLKKKKKGKKVLLSTSSKHECEKKKGGGRGLDNTRSYNTVIVSRKILFDVISITHTEMGVEVGFSRVKIVRQVVYVCSRMRARLIPRVLLWLWRTRSEP